MHTGDIRDWHMSRQREEKGRARTIEPGIWALELAQLRYFAGIDKGDIFRTWSIKYLRGGEKCFGSAQFLST
jgi:hypothetical protein